MGFGFSLRRVLVILVAAMFLPLTLRAAERTTIRLDGTWDIEDSKAPETIPAAWKHTAPVPGLAHSALPAFPHVDEFDSRMLIQNRVRAGKQPGAPDWEPRPKIASKKRDELYCLLDPYKGHPKQSTAR